MYEFKNEYGCITMYKDNEFVVGSFEVSLVIDAAKNEILSFGTPENVGKYLAKRGALKKPPNRDAWVILKDKFDITVLNNLINGGDANEFLKSIGKLPDLETIEKAKAEKEAA